MRKWILLFLDGSVETVEARTLWWAWFKGRVRAREKKTYLLKVVPEEVYEMRVIDKVRRNLQLSKSSFLGHGTVAVVGFDEGQRAFIGQVINLIEDEFPPDVTTYVRSRPVGIAAAFLGRRIIYIEPRIVDTYLEIIEEQPERKKEMKADFASVLGHELGHLYFGPDEWKADKYSQIVYDKAKRRLEKE